MPVLKYRDPSTGNYIAVSSGSTDHGALTGLTDDDHPQYVKADGSRDITGIQWVKAASDVGLRIYRAAANSWAGLGFYKKNVSDGLDYIRWLIGPNGDPESGSNEGSNLSIVRYSDTGSNLGVLLRAYRRSGYAEMAGTETFGAMHALNDTGWRIVTSKLQNGWTASGVTLRRVGDMCVMKVFNLNPSSRTSSVFYTLKTGWNAESGGGTQYGVVCTAASAGGMARQVSISGATMTVVNSSTGDATFSGLLIWFTDEAYPTATPES